jgi:uncharacterized protein YwlG (UPF0340 family)
MTKTELNIRLELHRRELKRLEGIQVNCQSCEHYARAVCLKFQAAPPPDVVAAGCDEWTYDFIPF